MPTVERWAGAPRSEAENPPLNVMSGWSSYRGRSMRRVLALLAAVGVTVGAFWLPTSRDGTPGTNTNAERPAAQPTSGGTATGAPTPSSSAAASTAPTVASAAPSVPASGSAGGPQTGATTGGGAGPGTQANPPTKTYANTAAFTGLSNGAAVDHCERLSGRSDLAPTKTLLTAHRRTSPNDGTYYFFYIDNYENGNTPPSWTTRIWFGSSPDGHLYAVYLLIMDVAAARQFWAAHHVPNGSYADGTAIPASAVVADQRQVTQTGTADC